jgi:hypothetical protein
MGDPDVDSFGYGSGPRRRAPRVRFSAFGEAWGLFTARAGTWIATGLVVVLGNWLLNGALAAVLGERVPDVGGGFRLEVPLDATGRWAHAVLSVVLNGFFLGGLVRMACLQLRGRPVAVGDLFSVTDVLGELAIGSGLFALALLVAGVICLPVLPIVVAGLLMFTIPLIVDGRLRGVDAVRLSWSTLSGHWLSASAFHFVANLLAGLGGCCFCCGLLVTMPLYSLAVSVLYRDFFLDRPAAHHAKKPYPYDPDFA